MLTNKQKKEYAETLYLRDNLTQKEIAQRVGITEKTMSTWVHNEKWEQRRVSIMTTKQAELGRMYLQLKELNDTIAQREEGSRYPSSKEADTTNKITASIRNLETETSVADIIGVAEKMIQFVRKEDIEKAKELTGLFDEFIKFSLK